MLFELHFRYFFFGNLPFGLGMQNIKALCYMKQSTLLMIGGEMYLANVAHIDILL